MALPFFNAYRGSIGRFFQGDPTLKDYWQLDGNSLDSSGNGNNGTDTNITYVPGKFGQCASFNGSSSKIALSKNSTTYLYNNWTMVAWVKRGNASNGTSCIYQMGNCVFNFGSASYYDGSGDRQVFDASTPTDTTNWYCYIWTKSSTAGQKLYRNGVLVGTEASTSNNSDNYYNVNIGRFDRPGNAWFNGSIDELAIFSRVLSPAEISQYYQWAISQPRKTYYEVGGLLVPNTRRRLLLTR